MRTGGSGYGLFGNVAGMLALLFVFASIRPAHGLVWIWDSSDLAWTTTLTDGSPIDTTLAEDAVTPRVAIDAGGMTYVVFNQEDTADTGIGRIYLSRYEPSGQVGIWDRETRTWTTTLTDGDPIDTGIAGRSAHSPQLAIDSRNRVYVVFAQSDGIRDHIYLSRYDGTDVQIYAGLGVWTTNLSAGSPIDANTGRSARMPQLAIDSNDQGYIAFHQDSGLASHIYLSRFNSADVRIWDGDTSGWTLNFANGDPIDTTLAREADNPRLAIDFLDNVYVAYRQNDGAFYNVYLSRFSVTGGVQIWNTDFPAGWTTTLSNGDPVGLSGASGDALGPDLAVDANDAIYIAYAQEDTATDRVFLTRYDGTEVQIWGAPWTTRFAQAQPIDTGDTQAEVPRVAVDSRNHIYVAFGQLVSGVRRIHLSRWNGGNMQIWDADAPGWTATPAEGHPIDAATGRDARSPEMTVDSQDRVYIAFNQNDGTADRVYMSRYDDTSAPSSPLVGIWNQDAERWTATFTDATPIDAGTGGNALLPRLAASHSDEVYITYYQSRGSENHIYLNVSEELGTPPTEPDEPPSDSKFDSSICFLSAIHFGELLAP
jgi:hypothetical protein